MSLNLRKWESAHSGLRRIAGSITESAEQHIDRPGPSRSEDLHEVRLCIKRMRAMWRLLRPSINERIYQRENARLRDVARGLGKFRDEEVMGATLQSLTIKTSVKKLHAALQELECEFTPALGENRDLESALRSVGKAMRRSNHALCNLTIKARGWKIFYQGLNLSYRRAFNSCHRAGQLAADEQFHVWRKRVKDFIYQLEIILPVWPYRLRPQHRRLKDLATLLGANHDLVILRQRITEHRTRDGARNSYEPVCAFVNREIVKLSKEALSCGNGLFHTEDKMWIKQIYQHWLHWRR